MHDYIFTIKAVGNKKLASISIGGYDFEEAKARGEAVFEILKEELADQSFKFNSVEDRVYFLKNLRRKGGWQDNKDMILELSEIKSPEEPIKYISSVII
jgi:hypothetical protein